MGKAGSTHRSQDHVHGLLSLACGVHDKPLVIFQHLEPVLNIRRAVSEAVRLAKKYDGDDTGAFVNGILGSYVRSLNTEEV